VKWISQLTSDQSFWVRVLAGAQNKTTPYRGSFVIIVLNMELSERWIKKFEEENFVNVYEWQDAPGTVYEEHAHKGKVSLFITDGSITFNFSGEKKEVKAGERLNMPVGVLHSAIVGPQGWTVIVGEEIEGDS
jgi:quercetin dioxygenase-like cupin family protein